MGCRITDKWTYRGFRTIILENSMLRATLLPESGAKLWEFIYKPADRELLWHNPRIEPRPPVFYGDADAWWCGGLDECIPTGHPCTYKGDNYPYLGETWTLPWEYELTERGGERVGVHLWRTTPVAPLLVERWVSLTGYATSLRMRHRVTNLDGGPFEIQWGLHPAWSIKPGYRIDLPDCHVEVRDSSPGNRLGDPGAVFTWPYATERATGGKVDMRVVPGAEARTVDFLFATGYAQGWLAITDPDSQLGVGMVFPPDVFRTIWLYLVYGGWRGYYTAAVEAWTGHPEKLVDAIANGMGRTLQPGEALEAETMLVAYSGCQAVSKISPDGHVTPARKEP